MSSASTALLSRGGPKGDPNASMRWEDGSGTSASHADVLEQELEISVKPWQKAELQRAEETGAFSGDALDARDDPHSHWKIPVTNAGRPMVNTADAHARLDQIEMWFNMVQNAPPAPAIAKRWIRRKQAAYVLENEERPGSSFYA